MFQLKHLYSLIFTFLLFSYAGGEIYTADWGEYSNNDIPANSIRLYDLKDWKIRGSVPINHASLPLYSDTEDTLEFSAIFNAKIDTLSPDAWFTGNGFHGTVDVYLNDNQILKQINDCAPFSVKLNPGILKNGDNRIVIRLKKSREITDGYPEFARLFTEPVYIGITRPFFISFMKKSLVKDWHYKTEFAEKANSVLFSYKINSDLTSLLNKTDGLSLEEKFLNENNQIISRRALDFSEGKEVVGRLDINDDIIWTPHNPKKISVILHLKRYGRTIYSDTLETGLRSVAMNNNRIKYNNNEITISGINYYENLKIKTGKNLNRLALEHLKAIKNDGFNAVRFISHIPDERFLSIADTLGLMVFIDLPAKRYPEELFQQDYLLENMKSTLSATIERFRLHPSFTAVGLGQEILLTPATQKFYFILNGFTPRPVPLLTYISPVPAKSQTLEIATDFYMLDMYASLTSKQAQLKSYNIPFILNGRTGFSKQEAYLDPTLENFGLERRLLLKNEVTTTISAFKMQGGFIDSFMDWFAQIPSHQTIDNQQPQLVLNGMYDSTFTRYNWTAEFTENIWQYNDVEVLKTAGKDKSTNVFSITMFFSSLIFLFFYRRYPRLSENYRRSLKHPYGFYVDMRERRIIPVFNSFVVGVHNALILATFTGSFVYFWNDSFLVEEIFTIMVPNLNIYDSFLKINHSTFMIIAVLFVLFIMHPLIMGVLLKIFGFISKHRIRLRQALAIGLWSGAPLVFMLPLSLAAYHMILNDQYILYLLLIFGLFTIWVHIRLINGIRVLTLSKFRTIFILLLLFYILPMVIFGLFFSPQPMWSDYLITLLNSHSLF